MRVLLFNTDKRERLASVAEEIRVSYRYDRISKKFVIDPKYLVKIKIHQLLSMKIVTVLSRKM